VVISLERSAGLAYGPADAAATRCLSRFSKIQIGLPFWYRLTWVVPDKGPLNGCVFDKKEKVLFRKKLLQLFAAVRDKPLL